MFGRGRRRWRKKKIFKNFKSNLSFTFNSIAAVGLNCIINITVRTANSVSIIGQYSLNYT